MYDDSWYIANVLGSNAINIKKPNAGYLQVKATKHMESKLKLKL